MPEQNDLRQDEAVEQTPSGLLLSVESLGQEGSNISYSLADDTDTSDADGTDTTDADGTDNGGSDADGTDTGLDADGAEPLGIGDSDSTDTHGDSDGRDAS